MPLKNSASTSARFAALRFDSAEDGRHGDRRSQIGIGGFWAVSELGAGRSKDGLEQDAPAT
jgi:hypothetical protein